MLACACPVLWRSDAWSRWLGWLSPPSSHLATAGRARGARRLVEVLFQANCCIRGRLTARSVTSSIVPFGKVTHCCAAPVLSTQTLLVRLVYLPPYSCSGFVTLLLLLLFALLHALLLPLPLLFRLPPQHCAWIESHAQAKSGFPNAN
jgi:hypothetical protein